MNASRLTLLGSQHDALTDFLEAHAEGHERAAVVLFKRLHIHVPGLPDSDRYLAKSVIPLEQNCVTESSGMHVAFNLAPLRVLFQRCEEENLVFGFVHNHPKGRAEFSDVDEVNERTLLTALTNRNGPAVTFVAMLWAEGRWVGRTRIGTKPGTATDVRHIAVLTERICLFDYKESDAAHSEIQARQAAAFGKPFVDMMQSLRVGIVGNGGTGSPTATLLARAGVGELVLIDNDRLEESNLNRVRGLTRSDVGLPKAERLKAFIDTIGQSVRVAAVDSLVDESADAVDALASCDVVIGATDDFIGRDVLNLALYAYAQVLIDVGLGGRVSDGSDGVPVLRNHFARISTITPETGQCLYCQGVLRDVWIRTQNALRENPRLTAEELKERYLENGSTDAPGVGPFTSAAADFAVATLLDLIKPFRRFAPEMRRDCFIVDFVLMEIRSHQSANDRRCPYCGTRELLLMKESVRLQRPILGKRDEHY